MGYFDSEKNVEAYIKMVNDYDGTEVINKVRQYLPNDSTVLELGMGPGTDLSMLSEFYRVTGSDSSQVFVDRYRTMHPGADVLVLDATVLDIVRRFDCVYSNKVLIHLTKKQCADSLRLQKRLLNPGGMVFHTFWYGEESEEHHGLLFTNYTEDELREMFSREYNVVRLERYTEDKKDDSILLIGKIK